MVAADVPGLCDSVKNPSSGYLIPHGDEFRLAEKIISIIQDSDRRKMMSINAREWSKNFDWSISAGKSLSFLQA